MHNQLNLLQTRRFLPLFIAQFFGAFNDNTFKNAFLIWFTYEIQSYANINSRMMVNIATGLFILPFFLFSATAGQIADKYEKSALTQKIKIMEIILMIACALCFFVHSVYGLLVVLFFLGVQATFFGPLKYSLLPAHLAEEELISGNGLIEGGTFIAILMGTIFGGLIILTTYGIPLLSLFVIAAAIIGWLASRSIPTATIHSPQQKIGWNIASETWRIIGYARQERTVWLSIIGISWFWLVGALFLAQFPTYSKQVIGGNEHIVTLFLTLFSIGIATGSVLCNRLLKGKIDGRLVPYGALGITVAIALFTFASKLYTHQYVNYLHHVANQPHPLLGVLQFLTVGSSSWIICCSLFIFALFSGIYTVPLYAIMQHRSAAEHLSCVIAANNVMNALFMVLASLFALLLFALHFSIIEVFLSIGIINIPVFLIIRGVVRRRLNNG